MLSRPMYVNRLKTISSLVFAVAVVVLLPTRSIIAGELPIVRDVTHQPLVSATERMIEALEYVGAPLLSEDDQKLKAALKSEDAAAAIVTIQEVLDQYCLAGITISAESRVKVAEGPADKELVQQGWRTYLVKVANKAGVTAKLVADSPNAAPQFKRSRSASRPKTEITAADVAQRFLDITMFDKRPLKPTLSGLELEYRIIQVFSRDVGKREARLSFNVGQGTQDIGFRNSVPVLFNCVPAVEVALDVLDENGEATTAGFVFRDQWGRVYPNPARRLAPDFFFHNQVYRSSGESIHLPPGDYSVQLSRGPEYFVDTYHLTVKRGVVSQRAKFQVRRWTSAAKRGWFSGDHHVHAAGCAHYENPTEGVTPADMMRHILGEDLNVGCVLSWGPCWYTQKQYFEGKTSDLSTPDYLMRYDVEVSGFPSSHAGHLCLLRLSEDDYPGTTEIEEWPSWTLPVLAWGKKQGGVVGYSHSGWGLSLPDYLPSGKREDKHERRRPDGWQGKAADKLPDYAMPPFDGIGANEYIVTVAHDVCDFISAVDTPSIWELNIWYHALNCGFRTKISGETDFPCIYGDKVGLGRIYVKLDPNEKLTFDKWIEGVRVGRSYCGDGLSHIFDFRLNDVSLGEPGTDGEISQLKIEKPGKVKATFDVAALLAAEQTEETRAIKERRLDHKPYWHLERSRIEDTRTVPVELIVNGHVAATKNIEADGHTETVEFDVDIKQSSWVAVRILPSVHTNPIFVEVAGKPVRPSRKSAEWCRQAVDVCWDAKHGKFRKEELAEAEAAYNKAREIYDQIIKESYHD